jgi:TPR repeat protein
VNLAAPDVLRMTGAGSHVEASVSLAESVMTAELHADALLTHQKTYGIKEPLDREQIAAIHLATQGGVFRQSLDVALRSGVSPSLPVPNHDSPFAPFLRLLISGLARLPPCADICFRGAPGAECASHCRMHTSLIWWTLSETTSSAEALAPPPPPPLSVADAIAAAAYESDDDSDAYYSGDSSLSSSPEVSPLRPQLSLSPFSRPNMSQLRLRLPSSENLFIPASPSACNDGRPVRTLFSIVTRYAVDVRRYVAHIAKGCELMLLPGARLEVKSVKRILGDNPADEEHVWLVQLEERQPPLCLSEYEARDSAGRPLSSYPLSPTAQRSRSVAAHLKSATPQAAVNAPTGSAGMARSSSAPDLETPRQAAVQDLRSPPRYAHESPQCSLLLFLFNLPICFNDFILVCSLHSDQQRSPAPPTPTFHAVSIDACEAMDSIRAGDRARASADYRLAAKHFQHAATLATGMTGNASVAVAAADLTAVALAEWAHCHITATLHALWGRPACSLGANRALDDPTPDDDDAASAVERSSGVGCVGADESDLIYPQMCAAVVTAASRSHERGCSLGASALARCAYYGIGMQADGARAFSLYTEAARSNSDGQVGVAWAYCGLGLCALHGVGRARDVQHALALFQRGVDTVTSIDITSTSRPFAGRSAAAACEYHLAVACLHGMTGSARNAATAVASLVRAVQLGGSYAPALHRLAACARAGIGMLP